MSLDALIIAGLAFAASLIVAVLVCRAGVLDLPGHRSLHTRPTPRGGGLGVVAGAGAGFAWAALQPYPPGGAAAILAMTAVFAALGLADDVRPLNAKLKFILMGVVGLAVAAALGPVAVIGLGGVEAPIPWIVGVLGGALFILVAVNAANFMDGSDGMLAAALIPAGVGLGLAGAGHGVMAASVAGWALAGGLAGFMVLNRPPAKVFAGDAGSLGVGALYASGALALAGQSGETVWLAPLFILPFLVDVLLTLLKRALGGRFSFDPHREHAYQVLIGRGWSHARMAGTYAGLSAGCVIAGLAAARGPDGAAFAVFVGAVIVLSALYGWVARRSQ